jgi:hypothetical protein
LVRYFKPLVYKEKALVRKHRGFLLKIRQKLAFVRIDNKKTRQTPKADAGLFLWAATQRGKSRVKRGLILLIFNPSGVDRLAVSSNHGRYHGYWNLMPLAL